jgi:hypothetical protein
MDPASRHEIRTFAHFLSSDNSGRDAPGSGARRAAAAARLQPLLRIWLKGKRRRP